MLARSCVQTKRGFDHRRIDGRTDEERNERKNYDVMTYLLLNFIKTKLLSSPWKAGSFCFFQVLRMRKLLSKLSTNEEASNTNQESCLYRRVWGVNHNPWP